MGTNELTPRDVLFCELYVQTNNTKDAYLKAGFFASTENSAFVSSHRKLKQPKIQEKIRQIVEEKKVELGIDSSRVINEIAQIAFGDLNKIVEINEYGNPELKKSANLNQLDGISASKSSSSEGYSESFAIKRSDRLKALDMLCKIFGIYDNRDSEQERNLQANAGRILEALQRVRK